DTWRWAGVPFLIRAGKKLPLTTTQVMVDMKAPPLSVFDAIAAPQSNYFRFRLSPQVVIAEGMRVKLPGEALRGEPVELIARHHSGGTGRRRRLARPAAGGRAAMLIDTAAPEPLVFLLDVDDTLLDNDRFAA